MKRLRWQISIILLTAVVVGILLITQKGPSAVAPNNTPEPVTGGIYTEALVGSLKRLNPLLDANNQPDRDVDRLIFSGLIRFNSRGEPQPDLAEKWGVSHDGTIYNFLLRDNLTWQDGQPITSDDVVYTFSLLQKPSDLVPADLQAFWKDVEIKRLDERNLQFRLPEPYAPFLDYLAVGILPKHSLKATTIDQLVDARFNVQPVGSGPYRVDRMQVENGKVTGIILATFDKYYGDKPFIPQVIFRYYPDAQSAFQAYQNKEVQGLSQVPGSLLSSALAEPNLLVYTVRQPTLSMVLFNLKDKELPFFQDRNIRQALMMTLNRQWIIDRVMNGQAILANGPLFPGTWAYYDGITGYKYDLNGAADLMKAAGYSLPAEGDKLWKKEDASVSFTLLYPDQDPYPAVADAIQRDWNSFGFQVKLEAVPYEQLVNARLDARNYQAALVDLNLTASPDPDPYPFWDQAQISEGQNYTQWDNRAVSEYLEQARLTTNLEERSKYYRNFQVIFNHELPALPLYYPVYTYAIDRSVQGVQVGPMFDPADRFLNITSWFLSTKARTQPASTTTN